VTTREKAAAVAKEREARATRRDERRRAIAARAAHAADLQTAAGVQPRQLGVPGQLLAGAGGGTAPGVGGDA
jgi:hypothetical protein